MSGTCARCAAVRETRPYGPEGTDICLTCAETPEFKEIVRNNFGALMEAGVAMAPPGSPIYLDATGMSFNMQALLDVPEESDD